MSKTFMSSKRRRIGVIAAAGALAVAVAVPAAAAVLASGPPAAPAVTAANVAGAQSPVLDFVQARSAIIQRANQMKAAQAAAWSRAHAIHEQRMKAAAAAARAKAASSASSTSSSSSSSSSSSAGTVASGSAEQIAQSMLSQFGWSSSQYSCLYSLWQRESGWSVTASNPSSGAYGIPQAVPGSKMASAGPDWQTNAATQIKWGLGYIKGTYGSPCAAWAHSQADGWY